jgi:hypothetical protein
MQENCSANRPKESVSEEFIHLAAKLLGSLPIFK